MRTVRSRSLPQRIVVGRVRRPHGVRGEVVVEVMSDVFRRFEPGGELLLLREGVSARQLLSARRLLVTSSRPHKDGLIVRFEAVDDRDSAAELQGGDLEVSRDSVPPAPEGSTYYFELVGCEVRDVDGEELGKVVDVVEDGGGVLLKVQGKRGELLVPFVEEMLKTVDIEAGEIRVKLPRGLVEICGSE